MRNIEILAPAGSVEAMKAAYRAGADAAYIGGQAFGARAYADNPDSQDLLKAIDYAHIHNKKLYLTVNTLMKNEEIYHKLIDFLAPFYKEGLDAVLMQDAGAIDLVHTVFPDLPIHASTQMTVCGTSYARWLRSAGIKRIVLPRELDINEIKCMSSGTGLDIEVFIHGALCYCYSGQCLMSSMIGGRSGNRGRCAQPCRLRYSYMTESGKHCSAHLLSTKDLCGLDVIPDLIDAGVSSLKIEGRMKSPEYAALTSCIYRKYADRYIADGRKSYHIEDSDRQALLDIYNRGGFTRGYFHMHGGPEMMSVEKPGNSGTYVGDAINKGRNIYRILLKKDINEGDVFQLPDGSAYRSPSYMKAGNSLEIKWKGSLRSFNFIRTRNEKLVHNVSDKFINGNDLKEKIQAKVTILKDNPALMEVYYNGAGAESTGPVVQEARKRPLSIEEIKKNIKKSGNSPFIIDNIELDADKDVFMPVSSLNELRRTSLKRLEMNIIDGWKRDIPGDICYYLKAQNTSDPSVKTRKTGDLSALVSTQSQLETVLKYSQIKIIYIEGVLFDDSELRNAVKKIRDSGVTYYIAMPHIFRMHDDKWIIGRLGLYKELNPDGFLIRNMESLLLLRENGFDQPASSDHNLYCMNNNSIKFYLNDFDMITLSPELNRFEIEKMAYKEKSEMIVYGRIPVMYSAQCLEKNTDCCTHSPGIHFLTDRLKNRFPVRNICSLCYNIIYNCVPIFIPEAMLSEGLHGNIPALLRMQFTDETSAETDRMIRMITGISEETMQQGTFTRGHYLRGVE